MKSEPTERDKCGTYAGYKVHRKQNEQLCQPCRDAMNLYRREYIKANPDFNARHKRTYRLRHPERVQHSAELTAQARKLKPQILETYGTDCYLCNEPIDLTAKARPPHPNWERGYWTDHVIPVSAGGTSTIDNLRPSHAICNIKKGQIQLSDTV